MVPNYAPGAFGAPGAPGAAGVGAPGPAAAGVASAGGIGAPQKGHFTGLKLGDTIFFPHSPQISGPCVVSGGLKHICSPSSLKT